MGTEPRTVQIVYSAEEPRGLVEPVGFTWEFDLGFSSAFVCAEDLGEFQIAITLEGTTHLSIANSNNWETPSEAYIDQWYFFRIGASSGAPIRSVNLVDLQILSEQGQPLCEDCESIPELQIGVSDYSPDNFIVQMILHNSVFGGHYSTQLDFTFEIVMTPEERRRRRLEEGQYVSEKVSLQLRPNREPIAAESTKLPTAT